ncbi:MAG: hypothetical protein ACI4J8_09650 [Oscillospiraceae bacterium]
MKAKDILITIAALSAGALLLIFPNEMAQAVSLSCKDCLEIIIPSLFPFTVFAVFLQKSGLYRTVLKPLSLPLSKLLNADEELCGLILLSNIGGYPVGARLLSEEVRAGRLNKPDAERLLCCCFGSGPSFVIGLAGLRVFGSAAVGAVIYCGCLISSLIIARFLASGIALRVTPAEACGKKRGAECFISSVTDGARVMFTVCAMIVGFAVLSRMAELCAGQFAGALFADGLPLSVLLEVSRVRELSPSRAWALPFCAAVLSFGGVCVQLQVAALGAGLSTKRLLLSRIPAAVISALVSCFAFLLPKSASPAVADGTAVGAFSSSALLSVCVAAISCILLLTAKQRRG